MQDVTDLPSSSRALVPLAPDAHVRQHPSIQRVSSFVAQLIANARALPQARARRRADPAEVIAAYRATIERIRELNVKS